MGGLQSEIISNIEFRGYSYKIRNAFALKKRTIITIESEIGFISPERTLCFGRLVSL